MNEDKCYVVVRSDMSAGYQIVQACHAVAEHEAKFPGSMSGRTMVVLAARNEEDLQLIERRCIRAGIKTTMFYEPDVQEYTAFASSPSLFWDEFVGLPLAGS